MEDITDSLGPSPSFSSLSLYVLILEIRLCLRPTILMLGFLGD